MTVKELIKRLKALDPNALVVIEALDEHNDPSYHALDLWGGKDLWYPSKAHERRFRAGLKDLGLKADQGVVLVSKDEGDEWNI